MSKLEKQHLRNSSLSYLALRQVLGVLGLAMPLLIWIFNGFELKSSISHYYYSPSSVIFTGFMITFGVFLIFYPGREDETDCISDNWITTIGGFGAILTAFIPTAYCSSCPKPLHYSIELTDFCGTTQLTTQYMHNNQILGAMHLCCAALFLILMGYMSYARFTKGNTSPKMKIFYKCCAFMVWTPLLILGLEFLFDVEWTHCDVYICECISIGSFGLAWLVKGKTFQSIGFE